MLVLGAKSTSLFTSLQRRVHFCPLSWVTQQLLGSANQISDTAVSKCDTVSEWLGVLRSFGLSPTEESIGYIIITNYSK